MFYYELIFQIFDDLCPRCLKTQLINYAINIAIFEITKLQVSYMTKLRVEYQLQDKNLLQDIDYTSYKINARN